MKFSISAQDIISMGKILNKFCKKIVADGYGVVEIAIYDGIAKFKTSNGEQTVTVDYLVDSDKDGILYVPAKNFVELAMTFKASKDLVLIESKKNILWLTQGKSPQKINILVNALVRSLEPLNVPGRKVDLGEMVGKVAFAVDTNTQNCMECFWLNDNAVAGSNTHLLSEYVFPESIGLTGCIDPKSIRDFTGEVEIRSNQSQIDIAKDNLYITTLMKDYKFPPYRNIIPKHDNYIRIDKSEVADAIRKCNLFVEKDEGGRISLGVKDSALILKSDGERGGSTNHIEGETSSDFEIEVYVNSRYLSSCLNAITGDLVDIYFGTDQQPIIVKSEESSNFQTLIMLMHKI